MNYFPAAVTYAILNIDIAVEAIIYLVGFENLSSRKTPAPGRLFSSTSCSQPNIVYEPQAVTAARPYRSVTGCVDVDEGLEGSKNPIDHCVRNNEFRFDADDLHTLPPHLLCWR